MIVCTHRKSARWKSLLWSNERASVFVPRHPHFFLFSLVFHRRYLPSNINNSKPKNGQLGNFRTLCFVVPSIKPLPLPQVFFSPPPRGGDKACQVYASKHCYMFLLLFLIRTHLVKHTNLDILSGRCLPSKNKTKTNL